VFLELEPHIWKRSSQDHTQPEAQSVVWSRHIEDVVSELTALVIVLITVGRSGLAKIGLDPLFRYVYKSQSSVIIDVSPFERCNRRW
jgi:hypothetical protein